MRVRACGGRRPVCMPARGRHQTRLLLHTYARASVKRRSESLLQFNWLKQPSLLHVKNFRTKNFARKNRAKNRPFGLSLRSLFDASFLSCLVAYTKYLSPSSFLQI